MVDQTDEASLNEGKSHVKEMKFLCVTSSWCTNNFSPNLYGGFMQVMLSVCAPDIKKQEGKF